jgi:hypothetical protein
MTKLLLIPIVIALVGCGGNVPPIGDVAIQTAVSVATSTTLKAAIKDPQKRTEIANYIEGSYAQAIRSIVGNPDPQNFINQLNAFIPPDVQQQYPELITFVNPLALWAYQQAYDKYNGDITKVSAYLNDIAAGLQSGAAQFATPSH